MEATYVSTNRWIDKEDMVYTHTYIYINRILTGHLKNLAICSNMDGPKWNKSDKKNITLLHLYVESKKESKTETDS